MSEATESSAKTSMEREQRKSRFAQLAHRLLRPVGELEWASVYSHDFRTLEPPRHIPGYSIREAVADDIDEIVRLMPREQPSYVIRRMWNAGHTCMVACTSDRVVAYDWMAFGQEHDEEFLVSPGPLETVCVNAYTDQAHRGRGLHQALLLQLLHHGVSKGFKRAHTVVSILNEKSWRAHVNLGWTLRSSVAYFRPRLVPRRLAIRLTPPNDVVTIDFESHAWRRRPDDRD